ncbi:hypothetical protein BSK66_12470 [Paenibacillus odorifer]|nr:hypothetical protein C171_20594 [Paenibacillus sp. FSL H8-237]OME58407.1 hypothetical protein BSK66_12470 [Paenibacillus odorifer]
MTKLIIADFNGNKRKSLFLKILHLVSLQLVFGRPKCLVDPYGLAAFSVMVLLALETELAVEVF